MKRFGTWALWLAMVAAIGGAIPAPAHAQPAPAKAPVAAKPARPVPAIERVVIISIDGLRPDLLIRAKSPQIHALVESGAFSFWARTTDIAITLPSHTSMLTGVPPEVHQINWNDDSGNDKPLQVPTVFELAHQAGYRTAMAAGKSKFALLAKPGTVDKLFLPTTGSKSDDLSVAEHAAAILKSDQPEMLMVHLANNDSAGHRYGWGSHEQIAALENADTAVGVVLTALDELKLRDKTLVILTADHGGQGKGHGPNDMRSRYIPWIASGPGLKKNHDLNQNDKMAIRTEDTCATALYVLGVTPPATIVGKPVLGIFAEPASTP